VFIQYLAGSRRMKVKDFQWLGFSIFFPNISRRYYDDVGYSVTCRSAYRQFQHVIREIVPSASAGTMSAAPEGSFREPSEFIDNKSPVPSPGEPSFRRIRMT
jgi:hypothetical protein